MALLERIVRYGSEAFGFPPDEWLFELVDGIVGDNYPEPNRMLPRVERVVHEFLIRELCGGNAACGPFRLFATEGASAAMCYIFDSLVANRLLSPGDRVAVGVPVFSPYLEIPRLPRYRFDIVKIRASAVNDHGGHTWQYPPEELHKLCDPSVRALFLVNPSNPPSVAMSDEARRRLVDIVRRERPDLMIVSDDVYCTFVDGFCSLLADLPHNTLGVYSLSKHFGVTGWRLGIIALHEDNVFDRLLKQHSSDVQQELADRYHTLTAGPGRLHFIDRIVADSRQVALNHTGGLSTAGQVQMALFIAFALLEDGERYKRQVRDLCRRRMRLLYEGLRLPVPDLPLGADYYTEFDLEQWARLHFGHEFTDYLTGRHHPLEILFRLAEESAIICLPGGGFDAPRWSLRVSLANLDDEAYPEIGRALRRIMEAYVAEWKRRE
jgi:aspartate 4-decarboxylase